MLELSSLPHPNYTVFLTIILVLCFLKFHKKISFGATTSFVSDYHSKVSIATKLYNIFGLLVMFFGTQKSYIYTILYYGIGEDS